ncbi:MAG: hypothetical protein RL428_816, partial [Actinomycetota bacterium]
STSVRPELKTAASFDEPQLVITNNSAVQSAIENVG